MTPRGTTLKKMMQEGGLSPSVNQQTASISFDKTGTNKNSVFGVLNQAQPRQAICLLKHSQLIVILPDS